MNASFVVMISFFIFIGLAFRFGYRSLLSLLDQKIADIRKSLDEAVQAKTEAVQGLYQERIHQRDVLAEIEQISKKAEEQTLLLRQQTFQEIEHIIATRQQEATDMVARLHKEALEMIQEEVAAKTQETFETIVTKHFTPHQHEMLNDTSIHQIISQLDKSHMEQIHTPKRKMKKIGAK